MKILYLDAIRNISFILLIFSLLHSVPIYALAVYSRAQGDAISFIKTESYYFLIFSPYSFLVASGWNVILERVIRPMLIIITYCMFIYQIYKFENKVRRLFLA